MIACRPGVVLSIAELVSNLCLSFCPFGYIGISLEYLFISLDLK